MHVTYIHQYFATHTSSTGTRSYALAKKLIDAGHSVSMICSVSDETAATFDVRSGVKQYDVDGIDVHCVGGRYSNRMSFYQRLMFFRAFAQAATRIACSITKSDLVYATSTPLSVGIPGMKAAKSLGIPFVFEVRDLWPELPIALGKLRNPMLKMYARRLEHKIYRAADHIVALSGGMKEGVCQTGYPEDSVTVIPNGCDLDLFRPTDSPLDDLRFGASDEFRLVFAGAHGFANGLDAVLDAAAVLKSRGVQGVRFVFVGQGAVRAQLMERSRIDGTEQLISWLPILPKHELAEVLPKMDVGMMILRNVPAFYYGTSPNKFFDYISSGLPILCNYPGWVADLIREEDIGVVVPPDDPNKFADAILAIREKKLQLAEMGRRSRTLAESRFSRDDLCNRFIETVESVQRSRMHSLETSTIA